LQLITWFLFFIVISCLALSIALFKEAGGNSLKLPEYMTSKNLGKGFLQNAALNDSKNRFKPRDEAVSTLMGASPSISITKHLNQKSPRVEVTGSH
jgi:hypothetical protein